jgi:hypothetical protein
MIVFVVTSIINSYPLQSTNDDVDLINNAKISFNNTVKEQTTTTAHPGGHHGNGIYIGGGVGGGIGSLLFICILYHCFCRR